MQEELKNLFFFCLPENQIFQKLKAYRVGLDLDLGGRVGDELGDLCCMYDLGGARGCRL